MCHIVAIMELSPGVLIVHTQSIAVRALKSEQKKNILSNISSIWQFMLIPFQFLFQQKIWIYKFFCCCFLNGFMAGENHPPN